MPPMSEELITTWCKYNFSEQYIYEMKILLVRGSLPPLFKELFTDLEI